MMTKARTRGIRTRAVAWGAALLLAVGGCASTGGPAVGGGTFVEVENNLLPPTAVSVSAVPEMGTPRVIGSVSPSQTEALSFNAPAATAQYQFVAETTSGREIVSNPLTVPQGSTVVWDLSSNVATIR